MGAAGALANKKRTRQSCLVAVCSFFFDWRGMEGGGKRLWHKSGNWLFFYQGPMCPLCSQLVCAHAQAERLPSTPPLADLADIQTIAGCLLLVCVGV